MAQLTSNQQHPDTLIDGGEPNTTTWYTLNKPLLMQLIQRYFRQKHNTSFMLLETSDGVCAQRTL